MRSPRIEAEIAALKQKIQQQRKTIDVVKADQRFIQSARVYLDQLNAKLATLERISADRKRA